MYDVIKDLKDIKFIERYSEDKTLIGTFRPKNTLVYCQLTDGQKPIHLHPMTTRRLPNWVDHVYNNVILYTDGLSEPLYILQDYGRDENDRLSSFKDWYTVPSELVIGKPRFNIGFYDGWVVIIVLIPKEKLMITRLFKVDHLTPKGDLSSFNQKRPFDARFMVEPGFSMESEVLIWVEFRCAKADESGQNFHQYTHSIGITYGELVDPRRLGVLSMSLHQYYNEFIDTREKSTKYLSEIDLINAGFHYDADKKIFHKDKIKIEYDDSYFKLLTNKSGKKVDEDTYLFRKKELTSLLADNFNHN
jgi:hypothetical protein